MSGLVEMLWQLNLDEQFKWFIVIVGTIVVCGYMVINKKFGEGVYEKSKLWLNLLIIVLIGMFIYSF